MKEEYDFTNAARGKFYKENAEFHTPVYLEPELEVYFIKLAKTLFFTKELKTSGYYVK